MANICEPKILHIALNKGKDQHVALKREKRLDIAICGGVQSDSVGGCNADVDMTDELFVLDDSGGSSNALIRHVDENFDNISAPVALEGVNELSQFIGMSPDLEIGYIIARESSLWFIRAFSLDTGDKVFETASPHTSLTDRPSIARDGRILTAKNFVSQPDHIVFFNRELQQLQEHTLRRDDESVTNLVDVYFDGCGNAYLCGQFAFEILDEQYNRILHVDTSVIADAYPWFGSFARGKNFSYIITNRSFGTSPVPADDTSYVLRLNMDTFALDTIANTPSGQRTEPEWAITDIDDNVYWTQRDSPGDMRLWKVTPEGVLTSAVMLSNSSLRGFNGYYSSFNNKIVYNQVQRMFIANCTTMELDVDTGNAGLRGAVWLPGEGNVMRGLTPNFG